MNEEEIKKEKEWYEKAIVDLTKLGIHNNYLNDVQELQLNHYKKIYLYLKQIGQLQNNWNELKKWLEDKDNNGYEKFYVEDILILMKDLEGNNE